MGRKRKTFTYTLTTSEPIWPRNIADSIQGWLWNRVISVTDNNRSDHTSCAYVDGKTYLLHETPEEVERRLSDANTR